MLSKKENEEDTARAGWDNFEIESVEGRMEAIDDGDTISLALGVTEIPSWSANAGMSRKRHDPAFCGGFIDD